MKEKCPVNLIKKKTNMNNKENNKEPADVSVRNKVMLEDVWSSHLCIDAYKHPEDGNEWLECPKCNLKPMIWTFDNGRSTACGCGKNQYDHFSIYAESIVSVCKRTGGASEYDSDELRKNWNEWCETGKINFDRPKGGRKDKRW